MGCVQFMCARIGMVTGRGLAGALREKFPPWLLLAGAVALLVANTLNVGADLAGMADAAAMWTGVNSHFFVLVFGVAIAWATIRFRYYQIAAALKWLAAVLFAYVITAFVIGPDWRAVVHDTFVPNWPHGHDAWQNLVAILGTTISPYLFFWQASQEVEEQKAVGRTRLEQRRGATPREISDRKLDVGTGAFFQSGDVFHHFDDSSYVARARYERHHDVAPSRRGAQATCRHFCGNPLYSRISRSRLPRYPNINGIGCLRFCRDFQVAAGIGRIT
jgi:Mn2+/Fe2+ NRAMP family transporter